MTESEVLEKIDVPFIDLAQQQSKIRNNIDTAIKKVLDHGKYIMGPEVQELEQQLSSFCNAKHSITCANGTDALTLALLALNVNPGDAILVPSFTFAATAEVVALAQAIPIFIDSKPDTYNIDPNSILSGIETAKNLNLNLVGIISVDIFGQPAEYDSINKIAKDNNLWVIADAAQSFGSTYNGNPVGSLADITTTSFFPAKPLGCYGDGGAIFTNNDELANKIRSLRVHGQGTDKYDNIRVGLNSRLDTIQAAILLEKLKLFPQELLNRQATAKYYNSKLNGVVDVPVQIDNSTSAWAQYTIKVKSSVNREAFIKSMSECGIPTVVYYINPLHLQTVYSKYPRATPTLPSCEELATKVLSLPMSGYVNLKQAEYITRNICNY